MCRGVPQAVLAARAETRMSVGESRFGAKVVQRAGWTEPDCRSGRRSPRCTILVPRTGQRRPERAAGRRDALPTRAGRTSRLGGRSVITGRARRGAGRCAGDPERCVTSRDSRNYFIPCLRPCEYRSKRNVNHNYLEYVVHACQCASLALLSVQPIRSLPKIRLAYVATACRSPL